MSKELIFHPIEEVVQAIKNGEIVIIADDPDRENEADLVAAASLTTPETIAFMASQGRGLICTPITEERADELNLNMMVHKNKEPHQTAFTVSVDAATGITTGISAADRAKTIEGLVDSKFGADDLVQPGHTFPLVAKEGGVLRRAGHTEASVDLAKMAGLPPAGVICEIMHEDGTMARIAELGEFQDQHQLKACTIAQLIEYRRKSEKIIQQTGEKTVETSVGTFRAQLFEDLTSGNQHIAFTSGEISSENTTPVRVHNGHLLNDILATEQDNFHQALKHLKSTGGVLLYLRPKNINDALLQEFSEDNKANKTASTLLDYGVGAQILYELGIRKINLLTNTPKTVPALEGYGLEIITQTPLQSS